MADSKITVEITGGDDGRGLSPPVASQPVYRDAQGNPTTASQRASGVPFKAPDPPSSGTPKPPAGSSNRSTPTTGTAGSRSRAGYASNVDPETQAILDDYFDGKLSLEEMEMAISSLEYDRAEAAKERAKEDAKAKAKAKVTAPSGDPGGKPPTPPVTTADETTPEDLNRWLDREREKAIEDDKRERKAVAQDAAQYAKQSGRGNAVEEGYRDDEGRADRAMRDQADKAKGVALAASQMAGGGMGAKASGLAQIAGTGMLGAEAAALATGPIGAAVIAGGVIYDQVESLIRKPFAKARESIDSLATSGKKLAQNDFAGIAADLGEGVAGFAEKAGLGGVVMAEFIRTGTAASKAFNEVTRAFIDRGRELAAFSGPLAGATAQVDVSRLQADIREAQVTGENLARLTQNMNESEQFGREIMLFLKNEVIAALAEITDPIADIHRELRPIIRILTNGGKDVNILATFVKQFPPVMFLRVIARILSVLDSPWIRRLAGEEDDNTLLKDVIDAADGIQLGPQKEDRPEPGFKTTGAPVWSGGIQ